MPQERDDHRRRVRKGMPPVKLLRAEFEALYRRRFVDPAFAPLQRELELVRAGKLEDPAAELETPFRNR